MATHSITSIPAPLALGAQLHFPWRWGIIADETHQVMKSSNMNVFSRMIQAILGALTVLGLHGLVAWLLVSQEPRPNPVSQPKILQVRMVAAPVVMTAPGPDITPPAPPSRPAEVAPPPVVEPPPPPKPKVVKAKPKPKAKKPKPKPKAKPRPKAKPTVQTAQTPPEPSVPATSASSAVAAKPARAAATQGSARRAKTGAVITKPRFKAAYLNNPPPKYPRTSKRRKETGTVLLKVKVSTQGRPLAVSIHRSSGFSRLDKAARKGVQRWKFIPAKRGDTPVVASVIVPIDFQLR